MLYISHKDSDYAFTLSTHLLLFSAFLYLNRKYGNLPYDISITSQVNFDCSLQLAMWSSSIFESFRGEFWCVKFVETRGVFGCVSFLVSFNGPCCVLLHISRQKVRNYKSHITDQKIVGNGFLANRHSRNWELYSSRLHTESYNTPHWSDRQTGVS